MVPGAGCMNLIPWSALPRTGGSDGTGLLVRGEGGEGEDATRLAQRHASAKTIETGLPVSMIWPVGVSVPRSVSTRNVTMVWDA